MQPRSAALSLLIVAILALPAACRRGTPELPPETYQQAVVAFHTGLAAMQTSQDVLAREQLERVTTLAPFEPAGWADLGLLLLRQQQTDAALQMLQKAAETGPPHAGIQRLLALAQSLQGNIEAAIAHWRRALEIDPSDEKAAYALAQELEREGGAENEAEAQRLLAGLAERTGNLAATLELARLAAKRGDADALRRAIDRLAPRAPSWPDVGRQRYEALRQAAARGAAEAATAATFLKNVLIRGAEYRAALSEVATPQTEVGEPLTRFLVLPNPDPRPAPADATLAFAVDSPAAPPSAPIVWTGVFWTGADMAPLVMTANPRQVQPGPAAAPLPFPGGPSNAGPGPRGIATADLNYDFQPDLVFAGEGGLRIYRQVENGAFTDVTAASGIPASLRTAGLTGVWPADLDTDGDLDLLVARRDGPAVALRNNGDGTLAVYEEFPAVSSVRDFVWADVDAEGVPDAAVLDNDGVLRVFLNLRGGAFREAALPGFPPVTAIATGDVSRDGTLDLVGVTREGSLERLSWIATRETWETAQLARVGALPADSGAVRIFVADLDNNGAGDLIVSARPEATRIALATNDGRFQPIDAAPGFAVSGIADLDRDGRLELVGDAAGAARVARSRGQADYNWLAIHPRAATATGDQRINPFGIGGEIEVRTGLSTQKGLIGAPVVHFGLGTAPRAEVARIVWPNGVLQSEFDIAADRLITATQRLKGSCPWLFAWNGSAMEFVTDFIWRSPLGLRINAQDAADVLLTEDWVKISGDQLAPRDGAYDLRITAELWETHFFDLVSLMVVDHPEGTEVFVDERFAVPPPALRVFATDPVQELATVIDDRNRDVRDIVRTRDDRHLDFAGRGPYQGVTRTHYVEIELPEHAPRTGPLWLIGQGWVHPTDSSINLAIAQGRHPAPEGLSLHVADAHGRFRLARAGVGFPSGKDKTVLIDLTGVFPADGPRRLRLQTNMEIFWDRLGWARGRPDIQLEPRRIPLKAADLRFRGYSETRQKDPSTPERPRYKLNGTAPRWLDLEGFYTRFGDVRELLQTVDDRYVIMNAGDEIRMTFPEAPPPAPGMVRDFVLVGDGWVKDGDFNTTASRTVLPLPTHASPRYDRRAGSLEDDPVYRQHRSDFERFHTRYVSPDGVRNALRR